MDKNNSFETESIWRLIIKNGLPSVISAVVMVIYNMADTFFIGQTHNDMMVAAVSVALPVFALLMMFGTLLGGGGCSVISNALGEKNHKKAKQISSFCFYGAIGIGFVAAAILLLCTEPILRVVGATDNTMEMAVSYLRIIAIGAPFIVFSGTFSNIIRADGAAALSMIGNMLGTVTNIILDPVFILGFNWGIAGAAWATVIGNILSAIYYFCYFIRKKDTVLSFAPKDFTLKKTVWLSVIAIGFPSASTNLLQSISNIFLNRLLTTYGDEAVAAMGVGMKIGLLVAMLQVGLCMGILPILAYNHGAKQYKRFKETIIKTGIVCVGVGSVLTELCFVGSGSLVQGFVTGENTIEMATKMVKALLISGPVLGLYFLFINVLQAGGKSLQPTIISLLRQGIIYIPALYLLNAVFKLDGLIYTQALGDILSVVVAFVACMIFLKTMKPQKEAL